MSAGITKTDGMAYVGRNPWHNLGTYVGDEAITAAEAIEAARLDWRVETQDIYLRQFGPSYNSGISQIEGYRAIVRQDTHATLAIMRDSYVPFQNVDAFKMMDAIVGAGDAIYHTVGSLHGGRRIWLLVRLNGDYKLDNGEKLDSFILLDTSHDGSTALRMRLTPVRVVCSNTLASATGKKAAFYARHTTGLIDRVKQARDLLGMNQVFMDRFLEQCNHIAEQAFSTSEMATLTYKLLKLNDDKSIPDQHGIKAAAANAMMESFHSGAGNYGETKWDAFNAITDYLDYSRASREIASVGSVEDGAVASRLQNSWFGTGQALRETAWNLLQAEKITA